MGEFHLQIIIFCDQHNGLDDDDLGFTNEKQD